MELHRALTEVLTRRATARVHGAGDGEGCALQQVLHGVAARAAAQRRPGGLHQAHTDRQLRQGTTVIGRSGNGHSFNSYAKVEHIQAKCLRICQ